MATKNNSVQIEQPKIPTNWNEQERRYANKVIEALELLGAQLGRNNTSSNIVSKLLESSLGNYRLLIDDDTGGVRLTVADEV